MHILKSLAAMALILLVAWLLSSDRKAIRLRVVGAAFALQAGFAALVLYTPWGNRVLQGDFGRGFGAARLCRARAPNSCSARSPRTRSGRISRSRRCR